MKQALELRAPVRERDGEAMYDLIAKTFGGGGYFDFMRRLRGGGYLAEAHYDWQASRIGLLDGQMVTHFGVWDYQTRVGRARLRTGGIGVVATHGEYRKRGLMDQTARASIEAMRQGGYDLTMLFGIDNFYHRFGYTRAFAELSVTVKVEDLPEKGPRPIERFDYGPRADLAELFNRHNATVTGTAVRPTFKKFDERNKQAGWKWTDRRGKLSGYLWARREGELLQVLEAIGETEAVLGATRAVARKLGASKARFVSLPQATPLAVALRRGTCTVESGYRRCGGAMVRIVNLARTMENLAGELSRRLAQSHLRGWNGRLQLSDGRERVMLKIASGKVGMHGGRGSAGAICGGDEMAQLLLGTDEPARIASDYGTRLSGAGKELLSVLFPVQYPMLHAADRY